MRKRCVEERVSRRAQKLQRILLGQVGGARRGLAGRNIGWKRIKSLKFQRLRVELAFPRGRNEFSIRERSKSLSEIQTSPSIPLQTFQRYPLERFISGSQSLSNEVLVSIGEAAVCEAHSLC